MEYSTFVILETISVISVLIGLVIFVIAKTIENKHDLDDLYDKSVSWWFAFFYTFAFIGLPIFAVLIMIMLIFAFCGVCDFIVYMGDSL